MWRQLKRATGLRVNGFSLPMNVATVLLSHAADEDVDFIVVGGYGHSRLREFVLGGVTRSMLRTIASGSGAIWIKKGAGRCGLITHQKVSGGHRRKYHQS